MSDNLGFLNRIVKAGTDNKQSYYGYDIRLKYEYLAAMRSNKKKVSKGCGIENWELVFQNTPLHHVKSFNPEKVREIYNGTLELIYKVTEKEKEKNNEGTRKTEFNGKVIKEIEECEDGTYQVTTQNEASDNVKSIVEKVIKSYTLAVMSYKEQAATVKDQLRIGTLDITNDGADRLVIHTSTGYAQVTGSISKEMLLKTISFISEAYTADPEYQSKLNIEVETGGYVWRFINGAISFDKSGLSEIEIEVLNDLVQAKQKLESTNQTANAA